MFGFVYERRHILWNTTYKTNMYWMLGAFGDEMNDEALANYELLHSAWHIFAPSFSLSTLRAETELAAEIVVHQIITRMVCELQFCVDWICLCFSMHANQYYYRIVDARHGERFYLALGDTRNFSPPAVVSSGKNGSLLIYKLFY